jgi:Holliday junction resolvase
MGKINSRDKGKRGELELSHYLKDKGYECRRGQQYSGTETTADVVGLPYIHIEVKRVEKLSLYDAIEQAVRDTGDSGDLPTVFHRRNGKGWIVAMPIDDWLKIYKEYLNEK